VAQAHRDYRPSAFLPQDRWLFDSSPDNLCSARTDQELRQWLSSANVALRYRERAFQTTAQQERVFLRLWLLTPEDDEL
jgi:hypothetical protein